MELLAHYDFAILGDHPAGLWAARQALALGKKVLIVPDGVAPPAIRIPKRVMLDFGLDGQGPADRALDPIQILTPARRFRIGVTRSDLEREYEFQFGSKATQGTMPRELFRGLVHLAGASDPGPADLPDWDAWIARVLDLVLIDRNVASLTGKMIRILLDSGAHVAKPGQLQRIFVDRKALAGIQLSGHSRMISTRAGFVCGPFERFRAIMTEFCPPVSESVGWQFEMRLTCAPEAVPGGAGSRMLYVEESAPILEILQDTPGDFLLRTTLPLQEFTLDRAYQRRLCERMVAVLGRFIPDLEYNLKSLFPDFRDPEKTEQSTLPSLYPYSNCLQIPVERRIQGPVSISWFQSPMERLFVASEESDPRIGTIGAYRAVVRAFEFLAKKEPVTGPTVPALEQDFR